MIHIKHKTYNIEQRGFTIVELAITIVLLAFSIIGIYGVFHSASTLTSNFAMHLTADYLAQEGLEVVKNIRDNNIIQGKTWSSGFLSCASGCQLDYKTGTLFETSADILQAYTDNPLNLNADGFYSYDTGTAAKFKRKITITQLCAGSFCQKDALRVDVLVTWDYNGKPFSFETIGYIYNLF